MSTPQQFSLRWNNYLHHITSAFDNLRDEDDFIDCTLSCDGKKIKAHKMLLSACSSYFREIFKENPCQHPVIILKGVTYYDLEALVDFMYNGEVNVNQEQLGSFLNTAELLQVRGLTDGADKGVNQQGTNSNSGQAQATSVPTSQDVKKVIDSNSASAPTPSPRSSHPSTPLTDPPPAKRKRQTPSVVAIATADHSEHSMSSSSRSPAMPSAPSISHVEASGSSTEMDASAPVIEPIDIPLKMEEPEYADENDDDNVAFIDDDDEDLDDDLSGHNDSDLKLSSELTIEPTAGPSNLSMLSKPGTSGEGNSQEPVHDSGCEFYVTKMPNIVKKKQHSGIFRGGSMNLSLTPQFRMIDVLPLPGDSPPSANEEEELVCKLCKKNFRTKPCLRHHMTLHEGKTTCPNCYKVFSTRCNMLAHIRKVHVNK